VSEIQSAHDRHALMVLGRGLILPPKNVLHS
jgi:hypothetical protein